MIQAKASLSYRFFHAQAALEQARELLAVATNDISEDSELYGSVVGAFDQLAAAARSIRILAGGSVGLLPGL